MGTITIAGDLLCYPSITDACRKNYDMLFQNVGKLRACDYLIGNLETPVAGEAQKYTYERYRFNTPTEYAVTLKNFGFDLLTLANNHALDRGETGLLATLDNCEALGIDTIGTYKSRSDREKTFVREIDGVRVAFVNYTYGVNSFAHLCFLDHKYMVNLTQPEETLKGSIHLLETNQDIGGRVHEIYELKNDEFQLVKPYLDQLEQDIKKAKKEADYVVMLLHCGGQYNVEIDPYSIMLAQKIKEYGADIVIGNHPHILQPCKAEDFKQTILSFAGLFAGGKQYSEIQERYELI